MREVKRLRIGTSASAYCQTAGLNESPLLAKARSPEIEKRVRSSTKEFHALLVTQRPTFVMESNIGDRAVLSGCWRVEPLIASIDSMLADAAGYASWKAHMGDPPSA